MIEQDGMIDARLGPWAGDWREWAILTEASSAAALSVLPYILSLQKDALTAGNARRAAGKAPITPGKLVGLAAVQGQVTFGLAAGLGLRAASRMGLGAPRLERVLRGEPAGLRAGEAAAFAGAGVAAALSIGALDYSVFSATRKRMAGANVPRPGIGRGLLATPYGAIAEEVLLRLCVQTLLAAGIRRLRGEGVSPPSAATMWPAIGIASLLFGVGHLPAASAIAPLTPDFVARTVTLNAVGGVVFGYLYWKEGLEAAMVAHGAADLVLHVGGPLVQRR